MDRWYNIAGILHLNFYLYRSMIDLGVNFSNDFQATGTLKRSWWCDFSSFG